MDFFTRSEAAQVLGISKVLVKNWTIGQPLRIIPGVRTALGAGSRNLYNRYNLFQMALANELIAAGLNSAAIQKVLNALGEELLAQWGHDEQKDEPGPEPTLEEGIPRLKIILGGDEDAQYFEEIEEGHVFRLKGISPNIEVTYDINIKSLVESINKRVLQLQMEAPYLPDDEEEARPSRKHNMGSKKKAGASKKTSRKATSKGR